MRLLLFAAFVAGGVLPAQTFEVASIKESPAGGSGLTSISPYGTGRFTATNATLELLVEIAFGVSPDQIVGAPGWMASERYDLAAKAEGGVILTYEQVKPRLRPLLEQQFHLTTHKGTKDGQGYALVVAKGAPKLKTATRAGSQPNILPNGLRAAGVPVSTLAGMLALVLHRPVNDETGLTGLYDITLQFAPANNENSTLPSVFTALQEQAGLKLDPRKVAIETLIIDHVERVPAGN
jgi:uncharacterized protein (TIGR03435 family)